jgi:hypothetical protein
MSTWALIQIIFDIFAALGFFVIVMRMNRAPKDDPRLSRGLQLLQSKIAVLEDLSDRTEVQVSQLAAILDQKCREVQAKVQLAEQQVHEIRVSMDRSLEVAKIFQDKIPHAEIIERQNTIKYVQAARLAHQGLAVDEISEKIDLPKGEIEFIAKVNRERLMFNEDQLPAWANEEQTAPAPTEAPAYGAMSMQPPMGASAAAEPTDQTARLRAEIELAERQRLVENLSKLQFEMQNLDMQLARESSSRDVSNAFETPKIETASLQKLGEQFRKACDDADTAASKLSVFPPLEQLATLIPQVFVGEEEQAEEKLADSIAAATMPAPQAAAPAAEVTRDPVLTRAMAQAKVQAALKASARPAAINPQAGNPELAAAKAMAKEAAAPVIRKVEFPKIDRMK